jgi:hypothetical protein
MTKLSSAIVISQLKGGLGNQLFQYAAGKGLATRLAVNHILDLSFFSKPGNHSQREYSLHHFCLDNSLINYEKNRSSLLSRLNSVAINRFSRRNEIRQITEPHFKYWDEFVRLPANVSLNGYWQSERYFQNITDSLREDLKFPPFSAQKAIQLQAEIQGTQNSVAVHVRRGDYVSNPVSKALHDGCCNAEYYRNALQLLRSQTESLQLYIFSDDLEWTRENFDSNGQLATYVAIPEHTLNNSHHDMHLMSLCKHHVIANSTFSWWGAWLSQNAGITCAPKKWFNDETYDTRDLYPASWFKLA